jgi:hypothetical protein
MRCQRLCPGTFAWFLAGARVVSVGAARVGAFAAALAMLER